MSYLEIPLVGQVLVPGVGERGDVVNKADALTARGDLGAMFAGGGRR